MYSSIGWMDTHDPAICFQLVPSVPLFPFPAFFQIIFYDPILSLQLSSWLVWTDWRPLKIHMLKDSPPV